MVTSTTLTSQEAPKLDRDSLPPMIPDRVVVINDVADVKGGATRIAIESANALRARGVAVTYITGDDAEFAEFGEEGIEVERIGSSHILNGSRLAGGLRGLYNEKSQCFLAEWISRFDTPRTIYHLHGWSKVLSPSVFHALKPVSSRLVVHAHDFFLVCPNGGYFDFKRGHTCELVPLSFSCMACNCDQRKYSHKVWRAARQVVRRTFFFGPDSCAKVLAVHDTMIPLLEYGGLNKERLGVLRNPVTPWRTERVTAERNHTFLFVGQVTENKGVDVLARAARQVGVRLRVIGSGPYAATLAQQFPEVELIGWKDAEEISVLCGDVRTLVMPTRNREPFGLVALEAMTSGLPVIVSANAMLADEIVTRGFGLSCAPSDATDLAKMIRRVAHNDKLVATMSRKAHAEARQLALTASEWVEALLSCYRNILQAAADKY